VVRVSPSWSGMECHVIRTTTGLSAMTRSHPCRYRTEVPRSAGEFVYACETVKRRPIFVASGDSPPSVVLGLVPRICRGTALKQILGTYPRMTAGGNSDDSIIVGRRLNITTKTQRHKDGITKCRTDRISFSLVSLCLCGNTFFSVPRTEPGIEANARYSATAQSIDPSAQKPTASWPVTVAATRPRDRAEDTTPR
jgi:hypothetical protein